MLPHRPDWIWWDWLGFGLGLFVTLFVSAGPIVLLIISLF